ncbi:LamG domain-containing protein [Streptacidiphilus sp. PAMC 29251]
MTQGEPTSQGGDQYHPSQQPTVFTEPVQAPGMPPYHQPSGPDWGALADQHEQESRQRRRRSWLTIGAVCTVLLLGTVAGVVAVNSGGGSKSATAGPARPSGSSGTDNGSLPGFPESASGSASATASSSVSATASQSAGAGPSASAPRARTTTKPSSGAGSAPAAVLADGRIADISGQSPLSPGAGAQVQPGNGSRTLVLKGTPDGYAAAAAPVVDTNGSFTVSAWVLNKAATGGRAAVSQGNGSYFSFSLGQDDWPKHHEWVFKVQTAGGGQDNTTYAVYSAAAMKLDTWVQLTGVYDASAHTIALYVNGVSAGKSKASGIWSTTGALQLGRNRYQGQWSDSWDGIIAHVEVWDRALTATQAAGQLHDKSGERSADSWLVTN